MTYIEFADKYLTPPERARFLKNYCDPILSFDLSVGLPIQANRNRSNYSDFIYDGFARSTSPEGYWYWTILIHDIIMRWGND